MKKLKNLLLASLILLSSVVWVCFAAPVFTWLDDMNIWYSKSFDGVVSSQKSLAENIYAIFFPSVTWNWGVLFDKLKLIAIGLAILFIIRGGAMFLLYADDENEIKKAKLNIMYMGYGAFLIFGAAWLLWKVLGVGATTNTTNAVLATQNNIIWGILIFFKSLAYYVAIILMVYYGYKIMQAQEKEDKIKAARSGAINIILALIAIKVLDYVYYIAQKTTFVKEGSSLISWAGKILGWILWIIIIVALLYAAVLLIVSRWNEDSWKKAKTIIRNVFLVIFVLFLFIVIIYDLFKNFS